MKVFTLNSNRKRYPCPVCCRFFCRDRDMIFVDDNYICESIIWEESSSCCDFSFPVGLLEEEITRTAREHIKKIKGVFRFTQLESHLLGRG